MTDDEENEKRGRGRRGTKSSGSRALVVEDSGLARPFMRGIMVHSLMARGVSFDEAYEIADGVRDRLRGRGSVPRDELSKVVREILGPDSEHQPPIPVPITLSVVRNRRSTPFSKGSLAQSLLAASVEPDAAFEVAREIELHLLREGRHEVQRSDLRTLAYRTLLGRFGRRTAQRYLVWREFEEPEKPVIILLGGTTGAGKTSLALEVARRLRISRVLSTDAIRQVMRIMLSQDLMPALHVSSFDADHTVVSLGEQDERDDETVIQGFMAQAEAVSVGVRAILDRAIEENSSLVLDGVSLVPGLLDLSSYAEHAHVFFLLVARLDEESFRSQFAARAEREKRRDASRYIERLDEILRIQEYLLEQAERRDVPIVDNVTLEGSVLLVIRHVVESLRKEMATEIAEPS
jgi:2-phosphoglycerate kinase